MDNNRDRSDRPDGGSSDWRSEARVGDSVDNERRSGFNRERDRDGKYLHFESYKFIIPFL